MAELLLALIASVTGIDRTVDPALTAMAQERVVEIQADFSHNGSYPDTAEVLAWNVSPDPVATLVGQWQGSPPHWAILTDPEYPRIGCAVAQPDERTFAVCVLAAGSAARDAPPVASPAPSAEPPVQLLLPNTRYPTMKTEPTAIVEAIRFLALMASFAGVVITAEEQVAIAAGITAAGLAVSAVLAIWNRLKVFSPATTQKLVDRAAVTGNTDIGAPPSGAAS